VRHVIEHSVLAAHWHVFGVLGWFSVLAALGLGPAGAVLYRLSEFVTRYWKHRSKLHLQPVSVALQDTATLAWHWIDWLPARVTAVGFAVVGSFEEAIDAWRTYAQGTNVSNNGVILAATSGAVNVRLGTPWVKEAISPNATSPDLTQSLGADSPPVNAGTPGQEPELAHLRSIVGLVWRSVVMWMLLLALLTLARLLG
jgi:adenosylcobinamide-phosphate synthase